MKDKITLKESLEWKTSGNCRHLLFSNIDLIDLDLELILNVHQLSIG